MQTRGHHGMWFAIKSMGADEMAREREGQRSQVDACFFFFIEYKRLPLPGLFRTL